MTYNTYDISGAFFKAFWTSLLSGIAFSYLYPELKVIHLVGPAFWIFIVNLNYCVDLENKNINLPASAITTSILGYLVLAPFWKLFYTTSINLEEVDNVYVDTKSWTTGNGKDRKRHIRYNLYVVGSFGSAKIAFRSRTKRDEVRNAIRQGINYCKKN